MKKLLLITSLLIGISLQGATLSKTITGANAGTNLLTTGFHLVSVAFTDTSGTNNPIKLFDAPTSTLTVVRSGFTNTITYSTNIVITTTNFNGVVQLSTNAAVYTIPNNVTAVTNSYNTLTFLTIPASGSVTLTPLGGLYATYGLTATNLGTYSLTVTYSSTL